MADVFVFAGVRVCVCLFSRTEPFTGAIMLYGYNQYADRCDAGGSGSHTGVDQLRAVWFQDCRKWCVLRLKPGMH